MTTAEQAGPDHAELVAAIHTRRIIRCRRVTQTHVEGGKCPACGL